MKKLKSLMAVTHTQIYAIQAWKKGGTQFKTVLLFFCYLLEKGGSKYLITMKAGDSLV